MESLSDYVGRFSMGIVNRNRSICATNNRQYGGVAIVLRRKTTSLRHFPLFNRSEHEVVAAVGKISGI